MSGRAHRVVKTNLAIAATVTALLVIWELIAILPLPLGANRQNAPARRI